MFCVKTPELGSLKFCIIRQSYFALRHSYFVINNDDVLLGL